MITILLITGLTIATLRYYPKPEKKNKTTKKIQYLSDIKTTIDHDIQVNDYTAR